MLNVFLEDPNDNVILSMRAVAAWKSGDLSQTIGFGDYSIRINKDLFSFFF